MLILLVLFGFCQAEDFYYQVTALDCPINSELKQKVKDYFTNHPIKPHLDYERGIVLKKSILVNKDGLKINFTLIDQWGDISSFKANSNEDNIPLDHIVIPGAEVEFFDYKDDIKISVAEIKIIKEKVFPDIKIVTSHSRSK